MALDREKLVTAHGALLPEHIDTHLPRGRDIGAVAARVFRSLSDSSWYPAFHDRVVTDGDGVYRQTPPRSAESWTLAATFPSAGCNCFAVGDGGVAVGSLYGPGAA